MSCSKLMILLVSIISNESIVMKEYELPYGKREFAIDALRAVLAFLHRHGYQLEKDGEILSLAGSSTLFIL